MADIWKKVDKDRTWLEEAIATISKGVADKLVRDNVTVYRVGKLVRIDIKDAIKEDYDDGYTE